MPRLCMVTVPELEVKSDWRAVHDRLLDDFPHITDVLATTTPGTLLIVYRGDADTDAWLEAIGETILIRRMRAVDTPRAPSPSWMRPIARPRVAEAVPIRRFSS